MLVSLENITFGYNDVPIVTDVSFSLHENERVGFIGGNGEGKTTLIKLILGQLTADTGVIFIKNGAKIGYLEQTDGLESNATVYEEMLSVFEKDKRLISRLEETQIAMKDASEAELRILYARAESINKQIAARDSYQAEVRVKTVLNGMGFASVYNQKISTMSGGEKTRLKLCRLLLEAPDLLILDEPTNHLDINTLFWLEDYLATYKGSLFVVSHDRFFLDKLTTRTLELERGRVYSYKGNYSKYKILKAERLALLEKEYEKQQEEIAHLQDYVDRNLVRATTAKSAQSRVKQLERIERIEKPLPPTPPPTFRFTFTERPYERVLSAENFSLVVENKTLIEGGNFLLTRGEKCALTGDNGTGKSTLLKFFLSRDNCVQTGKMVKIAYYDQENADLNPEERVLDCFWGKYSLLSQTEARKLLALSGLFTEDMDKKVKNLSGGERAKLELALLQAKHGNVLFLDEPTNHLDLAAREALERALTSFDGTILFVSHDRYFIQAIATSVALIENKTLHRFHGGYEDFLSEHKKRLQEIAQQTPPTNDKPKQTNNYRSKDDRAQEAKKKARIRQIENTLERLEEKEAFLNEQLAQNAADYEKVRTFCLQLDEIHAQSEELYAEYETLI